MPILSTVSVVLRRFRHVFFRIREKNRIIKTILSKSPEGPNAESAGCAGKPANAGPGGSCIPAPSPIIYISGMFRIIPLVAFASTLLAAGGIHEFTMNSIDGKPVSLADYKGKVVLLVNVASKCGYTPQYAGLEALYRKYKDQGLVLIGVPANNFGSQEPGTNEEIKTFCKRNYDVTFPMMAKVSVKGEDKAPLYEYLTSTGGGDIKWNFTKFLVDRDGKVIERFEPKVTPESPELTAAIEKALKQ
jgi:glutathione peroxidase